MPLLWIEENEERALADSYDYYRVPSVFCLASSVGEQEQIRLSLHDAGCLEIIVDDLAVS